MLLGRQAVKNLLSEQWRCDWSFASNGEDLGEFQGIVVRLKEDGAIACGNGASLN